MSAEDRLDVAVRAVPDVLDQRELVRLSTVARRTPSYGESYVATVAEDAARRPAERYAALYAQLVRHRHNQSWDQFAAVVRRMTAVSPDQPSLLAFQAEVRLRTATGVPDYLEALRIGRAALTRFDASGLRLLCAESALEAVSGTLQPDPELVDEAERHIERALLDNPDSPRFLATRARVYTLRGQHEAALSLLQRATAAELPDSENFALRIGEYNTLRGEVRMRRLLQDFTRDAEMRSEEFRQSRAGLMETMALLVAAVTLLVSAVQISGSFEVRDAAALIALTGGVVVLTFSSFSQTLWSSSRHRPSRLLLLVPAGIAASLVGLGLVLTLAPGTNR